LESPSLVLCDFDTIEPKNLLRQNFIEADVGKNKAAVLATRYGRHYGINMVAMPNKIEGYRDIYNFFTQNLQVNIATMPLMVIMCVDSVSARRTIIDNMAYLASQGANPRFITIIDSGNEDDFGQVNMFNPLVLTEKVFSETEGAKRLPEMITTVSDISFLPMDLKYYLDMQDNPGLGSCADLDQTLAINALIATNIMAMVQNFYYRKPFMYNTVHIDMKGGPYVSHNSLANFKGKTTLLSRAALIKEYRDKQSVKEMPNAVYLGEVTLYVLMEAVWISEEKAVREAKRLAAEAKKAEEKDRKEAEANLRERTDTKFAELTGSVTSEVVQVLTEIPKKKRTKKVAEVVLEEYAGDTPELTTPNAAHVSVGGIGSSVPLLNLAQAVDMAIQQVGV
jgi:molybdopterin/thiamine biosynthesis adenylyltransferase